jgi:hypothetical protein
LIIERVATVANISVIPTNGQRGSIRKGQDGFQIKAIGNDKEEKFPFAME